MQIIAGEVELDYLNEKLEKLMAGKRPANDAAKPVASKPKPLKTISARIPNASKLRSSDKSNGADRALISPDSSVRCEDPSCPIEGVHNIGRYYASGEKAASPSEEDCKDSRGKKIVSAAHFFNFTVPPPSIAEAYVRMTEDRASTADEDIVRRYQKAHMFSPNVSECQSPLPQASSPVIRPIRALVFNPNIYDAKKQELVFQKLEADIAEENEVLESDLKQSTEDADGAGRSKKVSGRSRTTVLAIAIPPRKQRILREQEEKWKGKALESPRLWNSSEKTKLRRMPKADDLREVQLTIKGNVIAKMAEQAVAEAEAKAELASTEAKSDRSTPRSSFSSRSRSISLRSSLITRSTSSASKRTNSDSVVNEEPCQPIEASEDIDRELEIHAALREKLKSTLEDGSFSDFELQDEEGAELPPMFKFDYLKNLLLIVDHTYQQQIEDLTREFRPSGIKVSEDELQTAIEEHLEIYEMLSKLYPSMKVEHVIRALRRSRGRARLENVC